MAQHDAKVQSDMQVSDLLGLQRRLAGFLYLRWVLNFTAIHGAAAFDRRRVDPCDQVVEPVGERAAKLGGVLVGLKEHDVGMNCGEITNQRVVMATARISHVEAMLQSLGKLLKKSNQKPIPRARPGCGTHRPCCANGPPKSARREPG